MRARILPTNRATGMVTGAVNQERFCLPVDVEIELAPAIAEALKQAGIGFEEVPEAPPADPSPPEIAPEEAATAEPRRRGAAR